MKKLILILTIVIGIIVGYAWTQRPSKEVYAQEKISQSELVHNAYQDWLSQKEHEAWLATESYGFTQELFLDLCKKEHFSAGKSELLSFKETTQALIQRVIADFDLGNAGISFRPFKDPLGPVPAAAGDLTLFIDESELEKYSSEAQLYVLGHEIQHIRFKDAFLMDVLNQKLSNEGREDRNHPYYIMSRFTEIRADIIAIQKDPAYARGYHEFYEQQLKDFGQNSGYSHPFSTDRLALAHNMINQTFSEINV